VSLKKLFIKCDIQEPKEQTIVKYLGGLEPGYANMVELQPYTTFDEVCVLAHKVEQQRKSRPFKREFPKPPLQNEPFNEGNPIFLRKPITPTHPNPQKNTTP